MLDSIIDKIEMDSKSGLQSLVVFDLDSTIFDVSPRAERILLDFAAVPLHKVRYPQQVEMLKGIKTMRTDWGIGHALDRAGFSHHDQEFLLAIHDYWKKNFFSHHYLQFDDIYDGALEFVQLLHKKGAQIAYLTGRDVERMGEGSLAQMTSWNFPLDKSAELVLKPHKSMDDAQFKTDWFIEASKKNYSRIVFFENEPVNLVHLAQFCPQVEMIFFESTHAGKAQVPEDLPRIINFLLKK